MTTDREDKLFERRVRRWIRCHPEECLRELQLSGKIDLAQFLLPEIEEELIDYSIETPTDFRASE